MKTRYQIFQIVPMFDLLKANIDNIAAQILVRRGTAVFYKRTATNILKELVEHEPDNTFTILTVYSSE